MPVDLDSHWPEWPVTSYAYCRALSCTLPKNFLGLSLGSFTFRLLCWPKEYGLDCELKDSGLSVLVRQAALGQASPTLSAISLLVESRMARKNHVSELHFTLSKSVKAGPQQSDTRTVSFTVLYCDYNLSCQSA